MKEYQFDLPADLVALQPVVPRDSSRLMVYKTNTDEVVFDEFSNVSSYLPKETLMILNSTKVIPSRITLLKKSTKGKVVVLILLNEKRKDNIFSLLLDRGVTIGEVLSNSEIDIFKVISHKEGSTFEAEILVSVDELSKTLDSYGQMPIPLYLRKTKLDQIELKTKYQTVFAGDSMYTEKDNHDLPLGSVAAPTASLHFSDQVLNSIQLKGIDIGYLQLEVGLGTFAPLSNENITTGKLHKECYAIPDKTKQLLTDAQSDGKIILACGTTVVRALESHYSKKAESFNNNEEETDLFIKPGWEFRIVSSMITNFHIPESSLMMMVQAFLMHKKSKRHIRDLYMLAIEKKMRFYSFGDAMLII